MPRHKRMTYKFIFRVFIVLEYQILNFRKFRDGLVWVSIMVGKMLDFASCFGGSLLPERVWVPRYKRTTYKFIFGVVNVLEY